MSKQLVDSIFVPFAIAKQLHDLGFNEPCIAAYDIVSEQIRIREDYNRPVINAEITWSYAAPTFDQANHWLHRKNIQTCVYWRNGSYGVEVRSGYTCYTACVRTRRKANVIALKYAIKFYQHENNIKEGAGKAP